MRFHRWYYWIKNEIIFYIIFDARRTKLQEFVKKHVFCKHINSVVKDQELAKKLTPSYNIGTYVNLDIVNKMGLMYLFVISRFEYT